jgi:hypothetical protein
VSWAEMKIMRSSQPCTKSSARILAPLSLRIRFMTSPPLQQRQPFGGNISANGDNPPARSGSSAFVQGS